MTAPIGKSWPYCEGHPHCHDRHTRQYTDGGYRVMITLGGVDPLLGKRLCPAHALIEFRCA